LNYAITAISVLLVAVVDAMTYGPDQILRMIALDQSDELLQSKDIWLCAGCYTCATRCPNDIDISAVMDSLRQMALEQGYKAGEPDAYLFHRIFMGVVSNLGRRMKPSHWGYSKFSHMCLCSMIWTLARIFLCEAKYL